MLTFLPPFVAFLIRTLALMVRLQFEDRCGITQGKVKRPVIWAFWHNRILMVPMVRALVPGRNGVVLTSPSKDGAILAAVMAQFQVGNVRGSSSRRGGQAMREMISVIESGDDVVITPDGPRGPMYKLGPGIIKLALATGTPVMPVHVQYSRCWQLKSWDAFRIPKPFSRVKIILGPLHEIAAQAGQETEPGHDGELFEVERARVEALLVAGVEG